MSKIVDFFVARNMQGQSGLMYVVGAVVVFVSDDSVLHLGTRLVASNKEIQEALS